MSSPCLIALIAMIPFPLPLMSVIRCGFLSIFEESEEAVAIHFHGAQASSKAPIPNRFAAVVGVTIMLIPCPFLKFREVNRQQTLSVVLGLIRLSLFPAEKDQDVDKGVVAEVLDPADKSDDDVKDEENDEDENIEKVMHFVGKDQRRSKSLLRWKIPRSSVMGQVP